MLPPVYQKQCHVLGGSNFCTFICLRQWYCWLYKSENHSIRIFV